MAGTQGERRRGGATDRKKNLKQKAETEGGGPEREVARAMSGGERAQLMMKHGRVGGCASSTRFHHDVRVHEAGRVCVWGALLRSEEESNSKPAKLTND